VSAIVVPQPRIVQLGEIDWHATPALEAWLPHIRDPLTGLSKRRQRIIDILLMAGSKADFLEDKVKNFVLGNVAYTVPSPVFFGLWGAAGAIGDAFNGGTAGEIVGGAYDRVSMTNNTTNFATVTGTAKQNSVAITFPVASANWNAGANINQAAVLDANAKTSGDNGMLWGDLTVPKPVLNGDTGQFAVGAFQWTED
jgi:hypothetical protein